MTAIGLITPTYSHDLERCALLCESVDRYVTSYARHYLIVPDDELELFAGFNSELRLVLPISVMLPAWLKPLPRIIQRNRRRFWWSLRAKPVSGWHIQQFTKIATASVIAEPLSCVLDSDVVFFRPLDLTAIADVKTTPLFITPGDISVAAQAHASWVRSSHRLLGLGEPSFPADDFIGHIIFWNQQTVQAMTARIQEVTGLEWIDALCRERAVSEYLLYGNFVRNNPGVLRNHYRTTESLCLSYWDWEALDQAAIERMLGAADKSYVAFSSASFNGTSVHDIRAVLERLHKLETGWFPPSTPATGAWTSRVGNDPFVAASHNVRAEARRRDEAA